MEMMTVDKTVSLELCVCCEICSAVCPAEAVRAEYDKGLFVPRIDYSKCTQCGRCLALCPGIDVDPHNLRSQPFNEKLLHGPAVESFVAYSNDRGILDNSTSGGLVTTLIIDLLNRNEFDLAFVLEFDTFSQRPVRLQGTRQIDRIHAAAKSKYLPASVFEVVKTIAEGPSGRYIIVGTPCQFDGIRKFLQDSKIGQENILLLGLFCDKTLNFNLVGYFEKAYGKGTEQLAKFEYRTKKKSGWPGDVRLCFDSGRQLILDAKHRMRLKPFFQLNRCLFCLDKLNVFADISFGDCYIQGKTSRAGKSSAIIRTEKGKRVFDSCRHLFTVEKAEISEIVKSQGLEDKKSSVENVRILVEEKDIYVQTGATIPINQAAKRGFSRSQTFIRWGREGNHNRIKLALLANTCTGFLRKPIKLLQLTGSAIAGSIGAVCAKARNSLANRPERKGQHVKRRNVVILGGDFANKGAQAMTLVVVDEVRRRFPDKDIYLFSTNAFEIDDRDKAKYSFHFLPWTAGLRLKSLLGPVVRSGGKHAQKLTETKAVLRNTAFIIDISGYVLSSEWGFRLSLGYIVNILIARRYSLPFYIFPQSFGPWDYPLIQKLILYPALKLCLSYPRIIFVRDRQGLTYLRRFTVSNVRLSHDVVLQTRGIEKANIFRENVTLKEFPVKMNSVAIVPNMRVADRMQRERLYAVYESLISMLLDAGHTVYILRHSDEDSQICRNIRHLFDDDENVILVDDGLNAVELQVALAKFIFIIASRYHSIIHAYKNGVPAVVIGWAQKYSELLGEFGQQDYYVDCRDDPGVDAVAAKLKRMMDHWEHEKEKITGRLAALSAQTAFDYLVNDLADHREQAVSSESADEFEIER